MSLLQLNRFNTSNKQTSICTHIYTIFFKAYKRNQPQWNIEKTDVSIFTFDVKCNCLYYGNGSCYKTVVSKQIKETIDTKTH